MPVADGSVLCSILSCSVLPLPGEEKQRLLPSRLRPHHVPPAPATGVMKTLSRWEHLLHQAVFCPSFSRSQRERTILILMMVMMTRREKSACNAFPLFSMLPPLSLSLSTRPPSICLPGIQLRDMRWTHSPPIFLHSSSLHFTLSLSGLSGLSIKSFWRQEREESPAKSVTCKLHYSYFCGLLFLCHWMAVPADSDWHFYCPPLDSIFSSLSTWIIWSCL